MELLKITFLIIVVLIGVVVCLGFLASKQRKKRIIVEEKARKEIKEISSQAERARKQMHEQCEIDKQAMRSECDAKILAIKKDCDDEIRMVKESIENRREVLMQMSEKTLLAKVMIALDSYGSRFERIETELGHNKFAEEIQVLTKTTEGKIDSMMLSLAQKLERLDISSRLDAMTAMILRKLDDYALPEQLSKVVEAMETVNSLHGDIDSMRDSVYSVVCAVDNVEDSVSSISEDIASIESDVADILKSITDEYSYDSLAWRLKELQSAVENLDK